MSELSEELREIQDQMIDLLDQAKQIVSRSEDSGTQSRATSYWIPQIHLALSEDHEYMAGSMCNMDDTIREIENE